MAKRGRPYPPKYTPEKGKELIAEMALGKFNTQVCAKWDINEDTFYDWLKKYPEFADAYSIGKPKLESYYLEAATECWKKGDDKGFKYFIAVVNNKLGWGKGEANQTTNNTQINIHNMQVLSTREDYDRLLLQVREDAQDLGVLDYKEQIQTLDVLDIEVDTGDNE